MSEAPSDWFYREGGCVTSASLDVTDPTPMHRQNAYRKIWRGEDLTAEERAALPDAAEPARRYSAGGHDELLGLIAHHKPEILHAIDKAAEDLAALLGLPPVIAWNLLADYTERARQVVAAEFSASLPPADPDELERWRAEADAWAASEEGRRAQAALEPDGGPEGWSQVPPANPDHGCHPSKRPAAGEGSQ